MMRRAAFIEPGRTELVEKPVLDVRPRCFFSASRPGQTFELCLSAAGGRHALRPRHLLQRPHDPARRLRRGSGRSRHRHHTLLRRKERMRRLMSVIASSRARDDHARRRKIVDEVGLLAHQALGLGVAEKEITLAQMALRAIVVYLVTLLMVRLGKKRFMGRSTAFDVILGIMLGSIVSRAITGNSPFFPALGASAVLVGMHWLFTAVAFRWHGFGTTIKGHPRLLVRDGEIDWKVMRRTHLSERDLWEDLRGKGVTGLEQVAEARLERSGQISVIRAKQEPKVLEVKVVEGVQTVRLEIG